MLQINGCKSGSEMTRKLLFVLMEDEARTMVN
jgi:hypothetical protein